MAWARRREPEEREKRGRKALQARLTGDAATLSLLHAEREASLAADAASAVSILLRAVAHWLERG